MSNKTFGVLIGVGIVCITVIATVGSCVKHIVSELVTADTFGWEDPEE